MRKVWKRVFVITLCTVIACSLSFSPSKAVHAEDIDSAKGQLTSMEKEKKEMQSKIAALEKEKGNIATYIEKLDKQMEELDGKITTLNSQIEETSAELDQTKAELKKAKETQLDQYDIMKARVKYMFENGSDDYLTMLLEASSLEDFLNQAEYISKISEYDQGLYTRYDATRQSIEKKEAEISADLDKLNTLQGKLQIQKDGLDTLSANKQKEMKQYEANIAFSQTSLDAYSKEIEKQEQLVQNMILAEQKRQEELRKKQEEERKKREEEEKRKQEQQQQQQNNSNSGQGSGSDQDNSYSDDDEEAVTTGKVALRWPLNVSGTITSRFVNRINPVTGRHESHKGLDIGVPKGTPIVAAASGTVLTAAYSSAMGNYVIVSHSANFYTIYMHASALKVSSGQRVSKGQTIALVGSTGQSTGNHLHFGVNYNGSYVNPENYVRQP